MGREGIVQDTVGTLCFVGAARYSPERAIANEYG